MRLNDQDRPRIARLHQALRQLVQIGGQFRADIGVYHGGGNAVELFYLRKHIRGEGDVSIRHCRLNGVRRGTFMHIVAPGMQVTHGDGFHAGSFQIGDSRVQGTLVQRCFHPPVRAHALPHTKTQGTRHQLHRRRHAQIIAVVLQPLAHFNDVAMAFGC